MDVNLVSLSDRNGAWVCSSGICVDAVISQMLRTASNAMRVETDEQCLDSFLRGLFWQQRHGFRVSAHALHVIYSFEGHCIIATCAYGVLRAVIALSAVYAAVKIL